MSISVFSVDKILLKTMDYETAAAAAAVPTNRSLDDEAMHSESSDSDSKCSSPIDSHNSDPLDVRNGSNLSQDILQTMIQSCRRLAANELSVRCECDSNDGDRKRNNREEDGKCEKCSAKMMLKKKKFNLSESFQQDKCNTIIDNAPVKPVLKFSVSAILSGTKSCSASEERILKSNNNRNGEE